MKLMVPLPGGGIWAEDREGLVKLGLATHAPAGHDAEVAAEIGAAGVGILRGR